MGIDKISAAEGLTKLIGEKGGVVEIIVKNVPAGLGDPVFDKLDAELAKGLMSIGAVKAVEIGSGVQSSQMTGFENNDEVFIIGDSVNFFCFIICTRR